MVSSNGAMITQSALLQRIALPKATTQVNQIPEDIKLRKLARPVTNVGRKDTGQETALFSLVIRYPKRDQ